MNDAERRMLHATIDALAAQVGAAVAEAVCLESDLLRATAETRAWKATGEALVAEFERLRARLEFVIGKATPVPSADPGEGTVAMLACFDVREWEYIGGKTR